MGAALWLQGMTALAAFAVRPGLTVCTSYRATASRSSSPPASSAASLRSLGFDGRSILGVSKQDTTETKGAGAIPRMGVRACFLVMVRRRNWAPACGGLGVIAALGVAGGADASAPAACILTSE
jgi:hypothetical protein